MSLLPTPILSLASHQLNGRGRGTNIWLSPSGCLQFSLLLRTSIATLPASKLVFVQYLFGLAVADACREETVLGKLGQKVRLKWPNDIYLIIGDGDTDRKKIGGILVNTNITGNKVEIVIGEILPILPKVHIADSCAPNHRLWTKRLQFTSDCLAGATVGSWM